MTQKYIRKPFPTLEEMHRDFELNCIPPDVPKNRSVEIKKAFMGGVASLFQVLKFEIPNVTDEEGQGYLERLDAQLVKFFTKDIHKLLGD